MSAVWHSYTFPTVVSLLLHGVLIAVMLVGWSSEPPPRQVQRPNFIQAQLVTLDAQTEQKAEVPPEPRVIDLTQQRREQERQAEEQRQQQAAQQRRQEEQRRQQEQRRQEEQRKAEQQRREDAERQRQAEAERQRQAEAERERQRQAEAERRQQEQAAQQRARAEEQQQLEASYAATAQSFTSVISRRIEQNWSRPPSARNNMECELLIRLVPTGRVIQVDVIRSSGNAQFDRSAVQAVQRAEQFPEVRDIPSEVFERYYRELTLVFRPQDLRQ